MNTDQQKRANEGRKRERSQRGPLSLRARKRRDDLEDCERAKLVRCSEDEPLKRAGCGRWRREKRGKELLVFLPPASSRSQPLPLPASRLSHSFSHHPPPLRSSRPPWLLLASLARPLQHVLPVPLHQTMTLSTSLPTRFSPFSTM
jgi:hypothetical protein